MIKVFRVETVDGPWNEKSYQTMVLDSRVFKTEAERVAYCHKHLWFTGAPVKDWNPPPLEPYLKSRPEPDIWYYYNGAIAVWKALLSKIPELETILMRAGQLLPQPFKGKELTICNITECVECIDAEKSDWIFHPAGKRITVRRPFFIADKLPKSTLFKIPQAPMQIFTWEKDQNAEQEFKACAEKHKLTSVYFIPIWSEEGGIISNK